MITTQDEYCHKPGNDPYWNESFYCNFFDRTGQWGGVTRVGKSPNRRFADGLVCLYFPDGAVGVIRTHAPLNSHSDDVQAGALVHQRLDIPDHWQIRYEGAIHYFDDPALLNDLDQVALVDLPRKDVRLQLDFEGWHELYDFKEDLARTPLPLTQLIREFDAARLLRRVGSLPMRIRQALKMSGAQHYEQAGSVHGTIQIDGKKIDFEGSGQRDHSWGVRDWKVPARWRWFVCQFGDKMAFNAMRVELLGAVACGGYCWRPEGIQPVVSWKLENTFDDSGYGGKDLHLQLRLANGEQIQIDGEVMTNIPMHLVDMGHQTVVNEGRARFVWEGNTGYGVSEFLEQIHP